ncbi:MAG: Calx-beta domain-containing protein [Gammaproteobacteria bacterium]
MNNPPNNDFGLELKNLPTSGQKSAMRKRNHRFDVLLSFFVLFIVGPATAQEPTPGTLQFSQSNFTVAENTGQATISVTRSGGSDGAASVQVSTSDGTASAGQDYQAVSTTLNWGDGDSAPKTFTVQIIDNDTPEPNKTVSLNLSNAAGATTGEPSAATLTITNDDAATPGTLQFSQADFSTTENAAQATIIVTRTGGSSGAVSVQASSSNGSAAAGEDYIPVNTVLTWADGDASPKTFNVSILDNEVVEPDETVNLTLSNAGGGASIGSPSSATLTITNDDQLIPGTLQFSQADLTVSENAGQATITVTRTAGSGGEASVRVTSSDGTAVGGVDYTPVDTTLTWADGDAAPKTFSVPILQDSVVEPDKTLGLTLSEASGATLGSPSTATLTITDDEVPPPIQVGFTRNSFVIAERSPTATVSVQLIGSETLAPGFQVSVIFSTSDGTAVAGTDYVATTQVLNFNAAQLTQDVTIPIISDNVSEGDKTVNLGLSSATGNVGGRPLTVAINPATATLTIVSDVPEGATLNIVSGQGQGGVPGTVLEPFVVAVTRPTGEPVSDVTVTWSVSPPQAGTLQSGNQSVTDATGRTSNTLVINELTLIRVTASVPGLTPVEFLVSGGLAGVAGLDEVAAPTAAALDRACPAITAIPAERRTPGQQQLLDTCNQLISGQAGQLNAALRALAPTEVAAQGKFATEIANTNLSNVGARILALRGATAGVSLSGLTLNYAGQSLSASALNSLFPGARGGSASADEGSRFGNWGVFLNGGVSFGDSDATNRESGFSFSTGGLTTGADYRFSDHFVLGGAFTYASQDSDFDASAGGLDITGYHFNVYSLYDNREIYYNDAFYVDAIASFGWNDYETSRRIAVGSTNQTVDGDTSGNEYAFSLGLRYKVDQDGFAFGPFGRLTYIRVNIDGYQETPANATDANSGVLLAIDEQTVDSLTTALGGEASYSFDTRYGVFSPHLRFDWTHQFLNDSRLITSRFLNDPTLTPFAVPTDSPDRNYFNLGIGAKADFPRGIKGFLYYQAPLGLDGLNQHSIAAGVRMEFD